MRRGRLMRGVSGLVGRTVASGRIIVKPRGAVYVTHRLYKGYNLRKKTANARTHPGDFVMPPHPSNPDSLVEKVPFIHWGWFHRKGEEQKYC